jgi:heme-degrading monooxygenase HmoA
MLAVMFAVNPKPQRWDDYPAPAALPRPEVQAIEGFLADDRFARLDRPLDRPGGLMSLSAWRDEKALIRRRTHPLHHDIHGKSRDGVVSDYHLRPGEVVRDSQPGGSLPRHRFDATEAGAARLVSVTEWAPGESVYAPEPAERLDSITRPWQGLMLCAWHDQNAATAALTGTPGRHRIVLVIRDHGMFARAEAPRYYPTVRPS